MQNKIFHEAADINDTRHMDIANRRQLFIYACSRAQRPVRHLDASHTGGVPQTGIYSYNIWIRMRVIDRIEGLLKVNRMNRLVKRSIQVEQRAAVTGQRSSYKRTKGVSGRPVSPDTDDHNRGAWPRFGQMEQETMHDGGMAFRIVICYF